MIKVPAGVTDAPHEVIQSPRPLVEPNYARLLQYTDLPQGGHFQMFEEPELVEKDLRSLVDKIRAQESNGPIGKLIDGAKNRLGL